jgi:hypothetical protein
MKQPLISMGNESLEDEEQNKFSKQSASRSIILCKSFLLGSSIGFALQVFPFAARCALVMITPASLLSSCPCLQDVVLVAAWLTSIHAITKLGSLCMREKFDKEDGANSSSGSIWTPSWVLCLAGSSRILFALVGLCFLVGVFVGSFSLLMIVACHFSGS